jgi:NTE family protein
VKVSRCVFNFTCAALVANDSLLPAIAEPSVKEQIQVREQDTRKTPIVALALGGGGVRGAAHIGVLRVLQKEGIPIDYVVGNSMGAVVGGLYCAGVSLDKIQSVMSDGSLVRAYLPHFLWCRIMLNPLASFIHFGKQKPYAGLVSGSKLKKLIDSLLPDANVRVESLKIPFAAIAVSLIDGQAHVLSDGRVDEIVRASATIPMLLRPVPIGNHLFIDGGVRNNLPTNEARHSGAKVVISVEIDNDMKPVPPEEFSSFQSVFDRVVNATLEQLDEDKIHGADIVIRPELINIPILSKDKNYVDEAVRQGEMAARKELPRILAVLRQAGVEPSNKDQRNESEKTETRTNSSEPHNQ